jgi:cytochrome c2
VDDCHAWEDPNDPDRTNPEELSCMVNHTGGQTQFSLSLATQMHEHDLVEPHAWTPDKLGGYPSAPRLAAQRSTPRRVWIINSFPKTITVKPWPHPA